MAGWRRIDELSRFADRLLGAGIVLFFEATLAEILQGSGKISPSKRYGRSVGPFGREVDIKRASGGRDRLVDAAGLRIDPLQVAQGDRKRSVDWRLALEDEHGRLERGFRLGIAMESEVEYSDL